MATTKPKKKAVFVPKYEYKVDYNDHFETPLNAYTDILPLLDSLAADRNEHILYDPYYCNGRTKRLLQGLGFQNVVHEKRDFYKDISDKKVPQHDTLVTNPPYSDDHKEKCLEFCVQQFREKGISFFLLIPNYVAARHYYRRVLGETIKDVAYLVPPVEYSYSHPEGTGHEVSPFDSLWFCGIGKDRIWKWTQQKKEQYYDSGDLLAHRQRPVFVDSFEKLVSLGIISLENRPNPKQRKKLRKMVEGSRKPIQTKTKNKCTQREQPNNDKNSPKKKGTKSKYRNKDGSRTKKRF